MTDFVKTLVDRCANDDSRVGLLTQLVFYMAHESGFDRERILAGVELALGRAGKPAPALEHLDLGVSSAT